MEPELSDVKVETSSIILCSLYPGDYLVQSNYWEEQLDGKILGKNTISLEQFPAGLQITSTLFPY